MSGLSPICNLWTEIPGAPPISEKLIPRSLVPFRLLVGPLLASTHLAGCSSSLVVTAQPVVPPPAPDLFEDTQTELPTGSEEFKAALPQALMDQDTQTRLSWMTAPFVLGLTEWVLCNSDKFYLDSIV